MTRAHRSALLPLALLVLACDAGAPSEVAVEESLPALPRRGPRIEGNLLRSLTVGLRLEKPDDAHFMPGSSLVAEADARVMDRAELWRRLEKPGLEPIVRLASTPEGRVGRDRVALLYVIPLRADESEWGLKMLRTSPLAPVLTGFAQGRLGPTPGFRVVEPAIDTTLAGLPGARIELRYEGEHGPTFEHMHVTRRLNEYWYLRVMVPEALDAESQAWLETIPEIFQLDPDLDP